MFEKDWVLITTFVSGVYMLIKPNCGEGLGLSFLPNFFWTQGFICHRCRNPLKSFWLVFDI